MEIRGAQIVIMVMNIVDVGMIVIVSVMMAVIVMMVMIVMFMSVIVVVMTVMDMTMTVSMIVRFVMIEHKHGHAINNQTKHGDEYCLIECDRNWMREAQYAFPGHHQREHG